MKRTAAALVATLLVVFLAAGPALAAGLSSRTAHPMSMIEGIPAAGKMRRAVLGDAPAVRALTRDAYAKRVPIIGREPRPMEPTMSAPCRSISSTF